MSATQERHYSVSQIAEMWGLSKGTVIRIFQDDPTVLKIGRLGTRFKRKYILLRVPESTLDRVYRRLMNPEKPKW